MMKILENKSLKQFIKFAIVGASGTAIDWILYFALTRWVHLFYLVAKTISFILAAANNYIWNRTWTFRSTEKNILKQFLKFFAVSAVGLGFNLLIMRFVVEYLGWSDLIGLILATVVVMVWNFSVNKFWTFKERGPTQT